MRILEILILLLLGSNLCFASSLNKIPHNGQIYDETLMQCIGARASIQDLFNEIKRASVMGLHTAEIGLLDLDEAVVMAKNKGLSPELRQKLASEGFYLALDSCYGDKAYLKFLFISSMVGAELSTRATGLALAGILVFMPLKFFKFLNASLSGIPGAMGIMAGYLKASLSTGLLALAGYSIYSSTRGMYDQMMNYMHPSRAFDQGLDAMEDEMVKRIKTSRDQLVKSLKNSQLSVEQRASLEQQLKQVEGALEVMQSHPASQQAVPFPQLDWAPGGATPIM